MALRIQPPAGPEPMPDLSALLKDKRFTIDGDAVMCPHCLLYQVQFKGRTGKHACQHCGEFFHLLKRGPWSFLTSKTEIPRG